MAAPHVLISGGSIAGPVLAHWLGARGWATTIVERTDAPRETGQNIDVRGAGREVLRRMDLEDEVLAAGTGEQGLTFVDERGAVVSRFPAGTGDTSGPTAELEILRGELSRLVRERTAGTEYVFGDQIAALDEGPDGVDVTFRHGSSRRFDLVVIAEGLTSRTRRLVFPDAHVRDLGLSMAYLTIPRTETDDDWWRWFNAPGSRTATLRPDNVGTTRATLAFTSNVRGLAELEPADQARVLRATFADAGWEVPRILDGLGPDGDPTPFYFDAVGQVRMPSWHSGRVAVVGDAAYCPSPLSGMGTTCAIVGAYVLAGELTRHADHRAGFAAYESLVRPFVENAQQLPPGTPGLAHPRSRAGVGALRTAPRVAASAPVRAIGGLFGGLGAPPADGIALPDYPVPAASVAQ